MMAVLLKYSADGYDLRWFALSKHFASAVLVEDKTQQLSKSIFSFTFKVQTLALKSFLVYCSWHISQLFKHRWGTPISRRGNSSLTHLFSFFRILWWCSSRLFDIFTGKRQLMLNGKHESFSVNRLKAFSISLKTNSDRESSFETCIHLNAESFCIDSLGVCCVLSIFAVSSSKISRWLLNKAPRGFEGHRWSSLKNVIDTRQRTHLIDGWSNSKTCRIVSLSFDLDKGSSKRQLSLKILRKFSCNCVTHQLHRLTQRPYSFRFMKINSSCLFAVRLPEIVCNIQWSLELIVSM
jgi:hypothetical protein